MNEADVESRCTVFINCFCNVNIPGNVTCRPRVSAYLYLLLCETFSDSLASIKVAFIYLTSSLCPAAEDTLLVQRLGVHR